MNNLEISDFFETESLDRERNIYQALEYQIVVVCDVVYAIFAGPMCSKTTTVNVLLEVIGGVIAMANDKLIFFSGTYTLASFEL